MKEPTDDRIELLEQVIKEHQMRLDLFRANADALRAGHELLKRYLDSINRALQDMRIQIDAAEKAGLN